MRMRIGAWFDRHGLPRGFLGMIAVVVAVEAFVTSREGELLGVIQWDWRLAGQDARGAKAVDAKVLCFGDSLVKCAVQPRVLGDRLGRASYNLAIGAGLAPSSFYLLQRALRAGARPSVVVVDFAPMTLRCNPGAEPGNWSALLSLGEAIDLARTTRDYELLGSIVARRWIPSLSVRFTLRARLLAMCRGRASAKGERSAAFRRNRSRNDGAILHPPSPITRGTAERFRGHLAFWDCNRTNALYLERFLALAEAHGIPVFWLLTPTTPELRAVGERTGFESAHSAFVASAQGRHPNVMVVDARRSEYGEEFYAGDPIHLNSRGAMVLSDDLASIFSRRLAEGDASRWVALTRDPSRPGDSVVKDPNPSFAAKGLPSSPRR